MERILSNDAYSTSDFSFKASISSILEKCVNDTCEGCNVHITHIGKGLINKAIHCIDSIMYRVIIILETMALSYRLDILKSQIPIFRVLVDELQLPFFTPFYKNEFCLFDLIFLE